MKNLWMSCLLAMAVSNAAAAPAEEPVKVAQAGVFTPESMHEALESLGYEPKLNASKTSTIQIDRDGTVLYHLITSVPESLMFRVTVAAVPENLEFAAPALQAFLQANERIAPAFFQYDAKNRHVQLVKYLPNVVWTPARLRREIDAFDQVARSTKSIWGDDPFRRLHVDSSPAAVAELRRLEGEFELAEGSLLDGNALTAEQRALIKIRITAAGELRLDGQKDFARLVIDPESAPGAVDFVIGNGTPQLSRYRLEGDVLSIHAAAPGTDRPKVGAAPAGKDTLLICRRAR